MRGSDAGFGVLSFLGGGSILIAILILAWFIAQFLLPFFVAAINNKLAKVLEMQDYVLKEIRSIRTAIIQVPPSATNAEPAHQERQKEPQSEEETLRAIMNSDSASYSERQEAKRRLDKIVTKAGFPL